MSIKFNPTPHHHKKETYQWLSLVTKLGTGMTASIIIFFLIGLTIDRILNIKGLFTIAGILIGIGIGATYTYRMIINLDKNDSHAD